MSRTPGPWDSQGYVVVALGAEKVITTCDMRDKTADELRANARLIAAAPELLFALKALLSLHEIGWTNPDALNEASARFDFARAVIAKAEGR